MSELLNKELVLRSLKRITHEILEKNNGCKNVIIVGIKRRGYPLALIIQKYIKDIENIDVEVHGLDISFYRDDLSKLNDEPVINDLTFNYCIDDKIVILVDDVLFTGRTIMCATNHLLSNGKPKAIELAVLVDRGHRELPIRPDFVGKNVPTSLIEIIKVNVEEYDGKTSVDLINKGEKNGKQQFNL